MSKKLAEFQAYISKNIGHRHRWASSPADTEQGWCGEQDLGLGRFQNVDVVLQEYMLMGRTKYEAYSTTQPIKPHATVVAFLLGYPVSLPQHPGICVKRPDGACLLPHGDEEAFVLYWCYE